MGFICATSSGVVVPQPVALALQVGYLSLEIVQCAMQPTEYRRRPIADGLKARLAGRYRLLAA
jgi:hypothetical protein